MAEALEATTGAAGVLLLTFVLAWTASASYAVATGRGGGDAVLHAPRETARLLRQRRRDTISADRLLWRLAGWSLLPVAVLPRGRLLGSDEADTTPAASAVLVRSPYAGAMRVACTTRILALGCCGTSSESGSIPRLAASCCRFFSWSSHTSSCIRLWVKLVSSCCASSNASLISGVMLSIVSVAVV